MNPSSNSRFPFGPPPPGFPFSSGPSGNRFGQNGRPVESSVLIRGGVIRNSQISITGNTGGRSGQRPLSQSGISIRGNTIRNSQISIQSGQAGVSISGVPSGQAAGGVPGTSYRVTGAGLSVSVTDTGAQVVVAGDRQQSVSVPGQVTSLSVSGTLGDPVVEVGVEQSTTATSTGETPVDGRRTVSAGPSPCDEQAARARLRATVTKLQDFFEANAAGSAEPPCSGRFVKSRCLSVMEGLARAAHMDLLPKNVIGVGSGEGFLEKCFDLMEGVKVFCYDKNPCDRFVSVQRAEFPRDIASCLPEDCSRCMLFAGYPQGGLGPVLAEFMRRGGEMVCTTVEGNLLSLTHFAYESDIDVFEEAVRKLRTKNTGECFRVKLREGATVEDSPYIEFYNFSSQVRQLLQNDPRLGDLCSDLDF